MKNTSDCRSATNVSVINSPTSDKPFYRSYTVDYLGNVVGGRDVRYLNLPMEELVSLVIRQLQDGRLVWFGSDVGKCGDRKRGIWTRRPLTMRPPLKWISRWKKATCSTTGRVQ